MGTHEHDLILVESFENGQVARVLTDTLLDPMETEAIHVQLSAALAAKSPPNMVISLESVTQLSSLMLSVLISLRDEAKAKGGTFCLAAVPERVDYLLKLTKLDTAFPIYQTAEDALASLE